MKRALSIRARLTLWTAAVATGALVCLAVGTRVYFYTENLEAIDLYLQLELTELLEELEGDEFEHDPYEPWESVAAFTADGELIGHSPRLPESVARAALDQHGPQIISHDEQRWRVISDKSSTRTVVAAHNLEEFDDTLRDIALALLAILPIMIGLSAAVSWLVAGRALAPLRAATVAAERIDYIHLSERLPQDGPTSDEIGRFTTVLNAMLGRIEKSFLQAKQFAGDASHELSTPLTIVEGEIEHLLETGKLPEAVESRLVSVQQETARMQRIIEQLLLLARFDAGRAGIDHANFNLSELMNDLGEDAGLLASSRSVSVTMEIASTISVTGDVTQIRRLLHNLLDNAVKYNRDHGSIACRLTTEADQAIIEITNTGDPIPEAMRLRVFDRFFQIDESRGTRGTGLGLSLCREIAAAHGGTIEVADRGDDLTHLVVRLPLATTPG